MGYSAALVYDSRIWVPKSFLNDTILHHYPINIGDNNIPDPRGYIGGGWRIVITSDNYMSKVDIMSDPNIECDQGNTFAKVRKGFSWMGPGGESHRWKDLLTVEINPPGAQCDGAPSGDTPSASGYADDGSGFYLTVDNYDQRTVYAPDGTQVFPVFTDTNGNYVTSHTFSNGKDTLGRTPILISSSGNNIYYDVLNAQGGRSRYTVTTQSINVSVPNYATTINVVQSIELPNGTSYQFAYNAGTSGDNWGELTQVTLPTGGQVSYGYTTFTDAYGVPPNPYNTNRWVTSRTSGGGTWSYTPQVTVPACGQCSPQPQVAQQVTVTKPSGDYSVYKFRVAGDGSFVTKEIDSYAAGGVLLRQEFIDYLSCINTSSPSCPVEFRAIPFRSTTTILNSSGGSLTTKTEFEYGNLPMLDAPTKMSQWNFYSGAAPTNPDRITQVSYSLANPTLASRHIINKPLQATVTDGAGNQVSQTSFTYDNYAGNALISTGACQASSTSQPPPAAPQHDYQAFCTTNTVRGNLTHVSQWLNTTGASITTAINTYDDTGNIVKTTDALGHPTQFTFSPTFGLAYLTQVQNALGHISTMNYDFNTGLVVSTKDPNGQVTGLSTTNIRQHGQAH